MGVTAKDLAAALDAVRKKRKADALIGTADEMLVPPTMWVSTGSWAVDRIIRGYNPGGIPSNCIVHIAGEWSTGKSVYLDHLIKEVQQEHDGIGYISEAEGSRDAFFADRIGVDLSRVVIDRPTTLEAAFQNFFTFHDAFRKKHKSVPVVMGLDSLDASKTERASGDMVESKGFMYGGMRSQVLGVGLGLMAGITARYPTTAVIINQIRDTVGVMFGPKKVTPGGNAPHFYASLEIRLSGSPRPHGGYVFHPYQGQSFTAEEKKRLGIYGDARGEVAGRWIRAKITKSKVSGTFDRQTDYYLDFQRGISATAGLAEALQLEGLLIKNGSGYQQRAWTDEAHRTHRVLGSFPTLVEWARWMRDPVHFASALGCPGAE